MQLTCLLRSFQACWHLENVILHFLRLARNMLDYIFQVHQPMENVSYNKQVPPIMGVGMFLDCFE